MRTSSFRRATLGVGAALVATAVAGVTTARLPVARAAEVFAIAREQMSGSQSVGLVHVNGRLVMRLRDTAQGGSGVGQAEAVARRLNDLNGRGALRPEDVTVRTRGNHALLLADGSLVVSVDPQQARAAGSVPLNLAQSWRNNLTAALREGGTGQAVRGGTAAREQPVALQRPAEETRTKVVPILSVGSALRVGIAQVTGPVSRVDEVKAVARFDTDYKDAVRIAVLVPIATENIVSNIRRVPQVSISAVGDLKL
jgi:hypothetical protein